MLRAVAFDWGDTVMRVFPEYRGPMARWPEVEAVPGAEVTLRALRKHYRLALATNAIDSGALLVREALARVGLEDLFHAVLTAHELGARKPRRDFFRGLVRELGCAPDEVAMVGDAYQADVVGAKQAGLRAIWFNPTAAPCPFVHPLHDGEAREMSALPAVLEGTFLPDVAECLTLLEEQDVSPGVVRHSLFVASLAFRLATWLVEAGESLDVLLTHRGALLHDLDKAICHRTHGVHGQAGAEVLRQRGYPGLARIAERHPVRALLDPAFQPISWEEKLVYYADKRLEEDRLVDVRERIEGFCRRHPESADGYRECLPAILELEAEICAAIGVSPAALSERLCGQSVSGGDPARVMEWAPPPWRFPDEGFRIC